MFKAAGRKYRNKNKYTDAALFHLISEGDRMAYAEIYDRYWDALFLTACSRLESEELAEDIVQDLFFKLYLNRHELHQIEQPKNYLFTALRYRIFSAYRSQVLHNRYVESIVESELHSIKHQPHDLYDARELSQAVQAITEQMPSRCREVFEYSRGEALSQKEIAEKMGISVSTVKKHLTKALRMMKKGLQNFMGFLLFF